MCLYIQKFVWFFSNYVSWLNRSQQYELYLSITHTPLLNKTHKVDQ